MNRFNVGNVVTNGMQTLSVAGFTGANYARNAKRQSIADAASGLNNLGGDLSTPSGYQEALGNAQKIGQVRAQQMMDESSRYAAKGTSPFQHLSNEEAAKYQEATANAMRKKFTEEDEPTLDDLMGDAPYTESGSPQAEPLHKKVVGDITWTQRWIGRNTKTGRYFGTSDTEPTEEE